VTQTAEVVAEPDPPPARQPVRATLVARVRRTVDAQTISLLAALVGLVVVFGSLEPDIFFRPSNLVNIANAIALLAVVAVAQTLVILSGQLDISVGAITGLASVAAAQTMLSVDAAGAGIAAAVVVGALAGLVNGLLITWGRINSVIATLGTLSVFQGLAFLVTNGESVGVTNLTFLRIGTDRFLGMPVGVVLMLVVAAAVAFVLRATDIGRNVYALGGNPVAAELAGIRLTRYRIGIFVASGAICGLAAVLLTARTGSGLPSTAATGLELQAITAAILGGCALTGGRGTVLGTVLGCLIIGTLANGLVLLDVPTFYQLVAKGLLLILAVMIQEFRGDLRRPARARAA
jgi:ribose transport system permease protein/L-arabinose transport system permease protein